MRCLGPQFWRDLSNETARGQPVDRRAAGGGTGCTLWQFGGRRKSMAGSQVNGKGETRGVRGGPCCGRSFAPRLQVLNTISLVADR